MKKIRWKFKEETCLDKIKNKTKICDTGIYGVSVKEIQDEANLISVRNGFIIF